MLQLKKTKLRVHRTSLCNFLQLYVNLQLSQNNNSIKKENIIRMYIFLITERKNQAYPLPKNSLQKK